MATRVSKRLAAPLVTLVSALALVWGTAGAATATPTDPPPPPPAWSGDKSADNLGWNLSLAKVNGVDVNRAEAGVNVVDPGDTITYRAKIWNKGGSDRTATAIRLIGPSGLEYVSSSTSKSANVSNEGAAGVKAVCSGGGCGTIWGLGSGFKNDVTFDVTYKIPATFAPGDYDAGFVFDVYSFNTGQGSNPAGAWIRVNDNRAATTTTVTAPATVGKGSETTLTATITPSDATGEVQFYEGTNPIGTPVTVSGGTATLAHTFAEMGTYNISAKYTATGLFHDSEGAATQVEVGNVVTQTSLNVPATAEAGTTAPLEATVTPADASGTVQFVVNGANVGNPVQVVGGKATLNHRFDDPGTFSVAANFAGSYGYANSDATAQQVAVDYGAWQTTTVVVEPVNAEAGSPTNLMATVRPIPTGGDIVFRVEGTEVGRVAIGTADGVAVLEHTFATAGSYPVVAAFEGTQGFSTSTSAEFTATVAPTAPVLTAVDANLSIQGLSVAGQTVTLIATVNPAGAAGTVQFYRGTEAIGTPVAVVDGKATVTTTLDFEGTQLLSAKFLGGDGYRDTVSNTVVLNVSAAPTAPEGGAGSLGSLLEGPMAGLLAGSLGG
ncbi:Ig-like domain-containing protein [Prescottella subtropica]|uniref:Ig-like domain-containing protein n=1 Tax=Prescottella subtropica TaxID=2545757 RepID=UPI0010F56122|nr:Ig-like domain-containing protein [Prescottella subtropica]